MRHPVAGNVLLDAELRTENRRTGEFSEGIVAPYLSIHLRLIDLATMQVRTQSITRNAVAGVDAEQDRNRLLGRADGRAKMAAAESLIKRHVALAVPALFARP
jgi:hypothetical protein